MKTKIFMAVLLLIFFSAFCAMAGDPNGHIDGSQWQTQNHFSHNFDHNGLESNSCQDQKQQAHGSGEDGFTGTIDMTHSQSDVYDFTRGDANHWGDLYEKGHSWGTVNPNCDLKISTHQNQNGGSVTNHSGNLMDGRQHANAEASAHLEGPSGTVGTDMSQSQTHGYYHENGPSWQGGQISTTTKLQHGTPPTE